MCTNSLQTALCRSPRTCVRQGTRTNPPSLAVLITGSDSPLCDSLLRPAFNPFTARACKIFRAERWTDAPVNSLFSAPMTHLLSMVCVLMKILSHASAKKKTKSKICKSTWCLTSTESLRLIRDGEKGRTGVRRWEAITTRMTPAFRWAAMRAILMFNEL